MQYQTLNNFNARHWIGLLCASFNYECRIYQRGTCKKWGVGIANTIASEQLSSFIAHRLLNSGPTDYIEPISESHRPKGNFSSVRSPWILPVAVIDRSIFFAAITTCLTYYTKIYIYNVVWFCGLKCTWRVRDVVVLSDASGLLRWSFKSITRTSQP